MTTTTTTQKDNHNKSNQHHKTEINTKFVAGQTDKKTTPSIIMQCHYEVLGVDQDADSSTIKKAHRKLAIKLHPDKNLNNPDAVEQFRLVQEAYECLSDPSERKWYDEHRDALLKGWSPSGGDNGDHSEMLFDVIPFMHAHCYTGYAEDDQSFYTIYGHVFASISKEEADAVESNTSNNNTHQLPHEFGNSKTDLSSVASFYQLWEGFVSQQTFAWADQYDVNEAENRRIRRAMEDENKKARKTARKARNDDILALVKFVKRRDPRMKQLKQQQEEKKALQLAEKKLVDQQKKQDQQVARDKWRQQADQDMAHTEEMDRLAGRVRLADLEDDYDYGGGKKKKKGKKKKGRNQQQQQQEEEEEFNDDGETGENAETAAAQIVLDDTTNDTQNNEDDKPALVDQGEGDPDETLSKPISTELDETEPEEQFDSSSEEEEEEEEPDFWRCDCCKKDFKSQGQMDNHMKSKKHKEAYKKYLKKMGQN
ncbi:protein DnaJ [Seminavis robusta]|uniref:Protein DnaJ n=1 Tax=Seminavis robusta TaxID=568900 RepID=A0A9N8HJD8_9STRA|nr:protein DnaJ [Seminavis robusta]|eukprot:Sro853_g211120.1 protein DnaJ (482) ;mRNA; f:16125-17570